MMIEILLPISLAFVGGVYYGASKFGLSIFFGGAALLFLLAAILP